MAQRSVLLISSNEFFLREMSERIRELGFDVHCAQSRLGIFRQIKRKNVDVIVIFEPSFISRDLFESLNSHCSKLRILIHTNGNLSHLENKIPGNVLWEKFGNENELFHLLSLPRQEDWNEFRRLGIIGESNALKKVFKQVKKVSKINLPVLITGESGVGKELIARAIHFLSPRAWEPFLAINCAAIPETLLESELFGYEKGSFTGAIERREGKIQAVGEGTLFMDEISELSLSLQAKLLRLLQSREYLPLGATHPRYALCRFIFATNQNLADLVKKGRFRSDLFFRLNVFPIRVPALRERKEDIPLLVDYFIRHFNDKYSCQVEGVDEQAMERLVEYDWPGNVRELENIIARLVLFKEKGVISADDLPDELKGTFSSYQNYKKYILNEEIDFKKAVNEFENHLIRTALERTGGNKRKAAQILGLKRTTLIEMLKRKGLASFVVLLPTLIEISSGFLI